MPQYRFVNILNELSDEYRECVRCGCPECRKHAYNIEQLSAIAYEKAGKPAVSEIKYIIEEDKKWQN